MDAMDGEDPDMMAMMGIAGFGSTKVRLRAIQITDLLTSLKG